MFSEELREGGEVSSFLGIHVVHQLAEMRMGFDYGRCLGGVYEG